jgi:hypothetical protein
MRSLDGNTAECRTGGSCPDCNPPPPVCGCGAEVAEDGESCEACSLCFWCGDRPKRPGSAFCSSACGKAHYSDRG